MSAVRPKRQRSHRSTAPGSRRSSSSRVPVGTVNAVNTEVPPSATSGDGEGSACVSVDRCCNAAAEGDWTTYLSNAKRVLRATLDRGTRVLDGHARSTGDAWLVLRAFVERAHFANASQRFQEVYAALERCMRDAAFLGMLLSILQADIDRDLTGTVAQSITRLAFAENGRERLEAAGFLGALWEARSRYLARCDWCVVAHLSEALAILVQCDANVQRLLSSEPNPTIHIDALRAEVQDSTDASGPAFALEAIVSLVASPSFSVTGAMAKSLSKLVIQVTQTALSAMRTRPPAEHGFLIDRVVVASTLAQRLARSNPQDVLSELYEQWLPLIEQTMTVQELDGAMRWRLMSNAADIEWVQRHGCSEKSGDRTEKGDLPLSLHPSDRTSKQADAGTSIAGKTRLNRAGASSTQRGRGQRTGRGAGRARSAGVEVAS